MRNALYVLLGVMAGFILAGSLVFVSRAPAGEPIVLEPAPTEAPIAVHVIGAVPRPGLYEFAKGARVQDAIDASGGLLASADANALNLAALLEDGQQLDVPYSHGQAPESSTEGLELPLPGDNGTNDSSDTSSTELININTASFEELDTLPGIWPNNRSEDHRL